jgi:ATP-dependent NAD(P)H-hydrate dehydratase
LRGARRSRGLLLLVDGSGLNIVAKQPELVQGYRRCVLTPNMAELGRLAEGVGVTLRGPIGHQWQQQAPALAAGESAPSLELGMLVPRC